jgi:hypothetical protein
VADSSADLRNLPLCDIVMDGGITSGVIYPKAVVKLSEQFRIKNIGGTSAGAIAAAATAAAEVGRLRDPTGNPGYKRLANLAEELSRKGFSSKKSTRLQDLFQPQDKTRPLFAMLISVLNQKSKIGTAKGLVLSSLRSFPWQVLFAFAIPIVIASFFGHHDIFTGIVILLISLISVVAVIVYSTWQTLKGPMVDNGYGVCKGYNVNAATLKCGDTKEPLNLWLSRLLNECAGKEPDDPPLTFGELWEGSGDKESSPPEWLQVAGIKEWHYVDLQMITTNVTHGRPYRFPFKDDDQKLYFKGTELEDWFPPNVVKHMIEKSPGIVQDKHILPAPEDLPVVFATRLSLSFPFLLSAVPLYATDFENPIVEERKIERCWFSDGGICSDFPIHFFDAPLPMWPTFGIMLESELTRYRPITQDLNTNPIVTENDRSRFFFPPKNKDGRGDSWARFDEGSDGGKKLLGFIAGLLHSARNWRDSMLTRAPGVRDRVVRIYLKKKEGGLNLNMEKNLITGLSSAGEVAATMLSERFSPGSLDPMNFDNHRWVRLRNLAAVADQDLSTLHQSISAAPPYLKSWSDLISNYPQRDYPVNMAQELKLQRLLNELKAVSLNSFEAPTMKGDDAPKRTPVIRIGPNI